MKIFLIGYRCTGKTSVGKILSEKLNLLFVDCDFYLQENEKKTISEIVAKKGWNHFRTLESKYLDEISQKENIVVSTGGGVVESLYNIDLIKSRGIGIWLKAKSSTIKKRILSDENTKDLRPSLTGLSMEDEIDEVLKKREPLYKKVSSLAFDTDSIGVDELADLIIKELTI